MNVNASAENDRPNHQNRGAANPVFFMFHYPACVVSEHGGAFPSTSFRASLFVLNCPSLPHISFSCPAFPRSRLRCLRLQTDALQFLLPCRMFSGGSPNFLFFPSIRLYRKKFPLACHNTPSPGLLTMKGCGMPKR